MLHDVNEIAEKLTLEQRTCIMSLSEEWQYSGYSKVIADILWSIGDSQLFGCFPALVDCDYERKPGISPCYRHKLTEKGLELKRHLLQTENAYA